MVVHTVRTVFAPVLYLVCHVCAVTTGFAVISIISLLQLRVFRITTIMLRARLVMVAFLKDWVFKYGILVSILSENGPRFVSKFFQSVCRSLDIRNLYTGTHYL